MVLGRCTLAFSLLITSAVWAQFESADMMKLAASRLDTIAKALRLSPEQVNMIKPLLESKYKDMGAVKQKFLGVARSDPAGPVPDARQMKYEAAESLKAINSKYDDQITSVLSPDQAKKFKSIAKAWKSDLSLNIPRN